MRALLAALLLMFALAPTAGAQGPSTDGTTVTFEPFDTPIPPLQVAVVRNYTANVLCPPTLPGSPPGEFHIWIASVPSYAHASFEPDLAPIANCVQDRMTLKGTLKLSVDASAPASAPGQLDVAFASPGLTGNNATGKTSLPFTTDYFGILDVQAKETIATAKPGTTHPFVIRIENLGNARGIVTFELGEVGPGLQAQIPAPVTLESRIEGGTDTAREVRVLVHAANGTGYLNKVGVVNMLVKLTRASDGTPSDESHISLLLTTRGLDTPGATWGAVVVATGVALGLSRRRDG